MRAFILSLYLYVSILIKQAKTEKKNFIKICIFFSLKKKLKVVLCVPLYTEGRLFTDKASFDRPTNQTSELESNENAAFFQLEY
jgi:hypothetical protein